MYGTSRFKMKGCEHLGWRECPDLGVWNFSVLPDWGQYHPLRRYSDGISRASLIEIKALNTQLLS